LILRYHYIANTELSCINHTTGIDKKLLCVYTLCMDETEAIEKEIAAILYRRNTLWSDLRKHEEDMGAATQVMLMAVIARLDEDVKDLKKKLDNKIKDAEDQQWLEFVSNAWDSEQTP